MINHIYNYCRNTFVFSLFIFLTTFANAQNNALILNGGYAVLNGGTVSNPAYLVINQPNTLGITRAGGGHINSENQYNYIKWVAGTGVGNYIFPFGVAGNAADYIPFTFNKTTAGVSDVQLSTWFTDVQNFPKPAATNVAAVTNMFGTADSTLFAIDRFWDIQASATADLTFSYRGIENTTINPTDTVKTQHWNGTSWDAQVGLGSLGVTTGVGTAGPFLGQTTFSPWVLSVVPVCPEDTISYANNPFCNNLTLPQSVTHTNGLMAGTFSAAPAGLDIDANTGDINPSLSSSGTYTITFTVDSTSSCPQFEATTTVTINNSTTNTDIQTACDTYTWIDGNTYTLNNNTATHTLVNSVGCDSVITLNLTINNSTTSTDAQTACDTYTWIDGNTYTLNNNTATHTLVNSVGCDSVITLNLTINTTTTSTDVHTACDTYTWIDGNTYTTNNNTATYTLTNAMGCDSVVTLNLTINTITTSTDVQTACDTYTWIDGNTYTSNNNTATHTLVNFVGCDSLITLNLTINNATTSTDVQTACDNYTWIDGNTYATNNNTATYILTNSEGCDSVITLNLTINPQLSATPDALDSICIGDPINLTATSTGNGILTWYNDATGTSTIGTGSPCSPTPTVSAPGTYIYYVNEEGACPSSLLPVSIVVNGVSASIGATPSSGFMPLDVIFTNGSSTGPSITYTWNFGDGTAVSNQFAPNNTYTSIGNYLATLVVSDGTCSASASILIEVKGQSSILIPNVFTPNGDEQNDVFTVEGTNLESIEADIFNRWGLSMYSWNQLNGGWNGRTTSGTEVPDGTYFYIIKAKGIDGTEYFKKGAFSLIR